MRPSRILAVLASLAMALTLLGITQTSANAATAVRTKATLKITPSTTKYKGIVTISGNVLGWNTGAKEWQRVPKGTVRIERRPATGGTWQVIHKDYTAGRFRLDVRGWSNVQYRVRYMGAGYGSGDSRLWFKKYTSGARTLWVRRDLNDALIRSGGKFYIWGNVDPGWANSYVYIQRKTCATCSWSGYKSARADSRGVFKIGIGVPSSGRWYFRAILPASASFVASPGDNIYYTYRTYGREGARLAG